MSAGAANSSAPYLPQNGAPGVWQAGGIFTQNASGCGQGSVLNVSPSGALTLNSPANSAEPGSWISAFGTAIYEPYPGTDAQPAPANPAPQTGSELEAVLDFGVLPSLTLYTQSSFWGGLAPGFAGLAQYNVRLPADVPQGCAIPLQIGYSQSLTQPVVLSIHQRGGQCLDPPSAALGRILWQKQISNTTGAPAASETLTVSLQASPAMLPPAPPTFTDTCTGPGGACPGGLPSTLTPAGPACPIPGYVSLDAGSLTASAPGLNPISVPSVPYQEGQVSGLSAYRAALPNGAIQAGAFNVSASGGAGAGPFQAPLTIGADIQLQTPLAGVSAWQGCQNLSVSWTGGDPNSWVTLEFIVNDPGYSFVDFAYQTRASRGGMLIPPPFSCPPNAPVPAILRIQVDPDPSEIAAFTATGLTLGGQSSWRYIHDFSATYSVGVAAGASH